MSNGPSWGTVNEAAERSGLNPMTIRRYIKNGTLPAHRVGAKLIRIDMADVDALFTPHEATVQSAEPEANK